MPVFWPRAAIAFFVPAPALMGVCPAFAEPALSDPAAPAQIPGDDKDAKIARLEAQLAENTRLLKTLMARMEAAEQRAADSEIELVEEVQRVVRATATADDARRSETQTGSDTADAGDTAPPPGKGGFIVGKTRVTMGGYLKMDINSTRYSDGALPTNSAGRDFYIPPLIPVAGDDVEAEWATDFNVRESRYNFTTQTDVLGSPFKTFMELDFLITPIGDERISNSSVPRMRHAYVNYKGFTIGQAWSTWMDLPALPENLDFIGPTEATNFNRQLMIRYKTGGLEVALEQPETTISDPVTGARLIPGTDPLPDLIARYRWERDWGHIQATAMLRYLTLDPDLSGATPEGDKTLGGGASVSGKIKVGARDDFKFMTTVGTGLGRYMGLNVVNAATVDSDSNLDTIDSYSGYVAYRHFWTAKLRSSLTLGYFRADNPDYFNAGAREVMSLHGNLIYAPVPQWKYGVEYIAARRELENGLHGSVNRFQFSTKYSF